MIEIAEVKEFLDGKYIEIKQQFWDANNACFPGAMEVVVKDVEKKFSGLFETIGQILERRGGEVGEITVSLIRQSAWEKRQRAVIEVFDSYLVNKKLIYTDEMDISWLFANWGDYKKNLEEEIARQGLSSIIREPYVLWMMEKSLKDLALVLAASLRPVLLDADELENFDKLIFREGFRISVGEYMDWQNLVFAIAPRCDIEDSNETDLRYQRVENKNYGGITFKDKDMSRAKFIHCSFQNCIFQNVSLREARFVNCRWKDVVLRNGSMETTGFINCSLVNFDAATMNTDGAYVRDCVMENVKLD